jgi:hypothetical protein
MLQMMYPEVYKLRSYLIDGRMAPSFCTYLKKLRTREVEKEFRNTQVVGTATKNRTTATWPINAERFASWKQLVQVTTSILTVLDCTTAYIRSNQATGVRSRGAKVLQPQQRAHITV